MDQQIICQKKEKCIEQKSQDRDGNGPKEKSMMFRIGFFKKWVVPHHQIMHSQMSELRTDIGCGDQNPGQAILIGIKDVWIEENSQDKTQPNTCIGNKSV